MGGTKQSKRSKNFNKSSKAMPAAQKARRDRQKAKAQMDRKRQAPARPSRAAVERPGGLSSGTAAGSETPAALAEKRRAEQHQAELAAARGGVEDFEDFSDDEAELGMVRCRK